MAKLLKVKALNFKNVKRLEYVQNTPWLILSLVLSLCLSLPLSLSLKQARCVSTKKDSGDYTKVRGRIIAKIMIWSTPYRLNDHELWLSCWSRLSVVITSTDVGIDRGGDVWPGARVLTPATSDVYFAVVTSSSLHLRQRLSHQWVRSGSTQVQLQMEE